MGLIIVTGDLTFEARKDEFDKARNFLATLMGHFDLGPDHLVVIPGNHDLKWTDDGNYEEGAELKVSPAAAREQYEDFYRELLRHSPNDLLSMGRRYVFDSGVQFEFCALNSNGVETGGDFLAGMGRLQAHAFTKTATEMGWKHRLLHEEPYPGSHALRILALHHHLVGTEDIELAKEYYTGFGTAIDARKIMRNAADFGVSLVLHGHRHRSFVWRTSVYRLPDKAAPAFDLGEISILGAGSAGSKALRS